MTEQELSTLQAGPHALPFVSESNYREAMETVVEPWLAARRTEVDLPIRGGMLHTENYLLPGSTQAVVMLHGYTESAEKLREMAWYFLHCGYSVFSYDHRGHGRSARSVQDESITHVDHFGTYLEDLKTFLDSYVRKQLPEATLYLYAHSMGGAVGAHFLIDHPEYFSKAILSSPMIAPSAKPFPLWVGGGMAGAMVGLGKGKERAFIGKPFDAASETFEASCTSCEARFRYYADKRAATRYLQNSSPTYRWTLEAVTQRHKLLKPACAGKIGIPVLLCQAGLDNVVLLPEQNRFISLVPQGKLIRYDQTKHEIYNSPDVLMKDYLNDLLTFLADS